MTPKMLDHITIRGFRSIAAVERLELRALNVLIGANGSGKSNFLEVFKFLRKIREGRLQDYIGQQGGADSILHFGGEATPNLDLDLSFGGGVAIVEVGSDAGMPCARTSFVISARTGRASPLRWSTTTPFLRRDRGAWPGRSSASQHATSSQRAEAVEAALLEDIARKMGPGFDPQRFEPHSRLATLP